MPHRPARFLAALLCIAATSASMPSAWPDDSIETAKDDREDSRRTQLEAEAELDSITAEDEEIVAALDAATELVQLEQAKVAAAQQRLAIANEQRRDAEAAVADAGDAIALLRDAAIKYAVESYVGLSNGRTETWLEADDATTAAHKVALLEAVNSETTDVLDRLRAIEDYRRDLLADADAARGAADDVQGELDAALAELESKRQVQVALKAELDARRTQWEAKLAAAEQEEAKLTAYIKAEEARRERERAEKAAAAARARTLQARIGVINAAGWQWPTSGGVASGFGQRLHPILGYYRMHTGADIGGAQGQPIWAATEGLVIFTGNNGGYGNNVVIQHVNGVTTLYGHMSSIAVAEGDYVLAGDTIGAVGSTGLSTGPHLHFEVRIHGAPVDPLPYLP